MKKILLFFALSLFINSLSAQNLVLNPSFENTSACPIGVGEFGNALNWDDLNSGADSCSSPDLHAACAPAIGGVSTPTSILFGYQPSRTGSNHAGAIFYEALAFGCTPLGIAGDYREYLGGQLSSPLQAGQTYCVSFYINLANNSSWGIANLGFYFSNNVISHNFCTNGDLLPVTPQLVYTGPALTDTTNWVQIQWNYVATGGEQYFAIGNFDDNASTTIANVACNGNPIALPDAYYLIDDVSVELSACCNLALSSVETNVSCGATNDGAIDLTVSTGTAPYTYSWSTGATTEDLLGLTTGTYDVTVTDATGCSATLSATVSGSAGLSVSGVVTDVNCGSTNNGAIDITPTGTAPYTYSWSTGATTEDLSGLTTGTYDVTVTDAGGCTATYSGVVASTPGLVLTTTAVDPSCNANADGCAIVATSATGALTYDWSTGATTDTVCGLAAGTYDVTVTQGGSVAGTDTLYFENFEGTVPLVTTPTGVNSASPQQWQISDAEGGVLPPACGVGGNGDQTLHITCTSLFCGLLITGAVYNATETSNIRAELPTFSTVGYTGVTLEFDFISEGDGLLDNASVLYNDGTGWQVLDPSIKSGVCVSGQGQWTAFSATLPASCDNNPNVQIGFNWTNNGDNAGTDPSIAINNVLVTSTSTGGTACSATASVVLTDPAVLSASTTTSDENCGLADGAVDLTVSGGTAPYNYLWSNAATTEDLTGLSAGTYDVTITDANGCSISSSAVVNGSSAPVVSVSVTDASCGANDGAIDLTVSGAAPPYSFSWSNGASTEDLTGLAAASYSVTVTDNNGCIAIQSAVVNSIGGATVTLNSVTNVDCNGAATGAIDIDATAANLSCSSTSVVINEVLANVDGVGDGTGCGNATNPLSAEFIELIGPAGTDISCYILTDGDWTITIPSGTTIPADGLFTIGNNNTPLHTGSGTTFDLDVNNCGCFTDSCQLMIFTNGGEYLAIYDATGTFIDGLMYGSPSAGNTPPAGINTTGGIINTAGLGGCVSSVTIPGPAAFNTVSVSQEGLSYVRVPDGAGNSFTTDSISPNACNSTAVSNLTYNWSTGDTTQDISGLTAGVYTVTVTDGAGCSSVQSFTVTEPSAVTITTNTIVDASCISAGSIDVSATGGTGTLTYLWDDPAAQTTAIATGLQAGSYNVTVTDANGCETVAGPYTVNGSGVPTITLANQTNVICSGGSSASIDITVSGGTTPYTYAWSNGQAVEDISNLAAGSYTVTATDNNGCTVSSTVTITEPSPISLSVLIGNATCVGDDGVIDLTVSGGSAPYTYQWDNGQATEDLNNLANADYEVTVTDANGCSTTYGGPVTVALDTTISLQTAVTDLDCSGDSTGSVSLVVNNAAPAYTYIWSTGDTSASLNALGAGTYEVTVTDASGCSISTSTTVNTPLVPTVSAYIGQVGVVNDSIELGDEITLNAGNDQTATGVTYSWTANPSDVGFTTANAVSTNATPESSGDYSFTVIAISPDACSDTSTVTVYVNELLDPAVPTAFTPNADGTNDLFSVVNLPVEHLIEFKVFNRWGTVVYDDATNGVWDGSYNGVAQPTDAYIYLISYQRPQDAEPVVLRGQVTLLR
jgi:gliding motility-associated-like protein